MNCEYSKEAKWFVTFCFRGGCALYVRLAKSFNTPGKSPNLNIDFILTFIPRHSVRHLLLKPAYAEADFEYGQNVSGMVILATTG